MPHIFGPARATRSFDMLLGYFFPVSCEYAALVVGCGRSLFQIMYEHSPINYAITQGGNVSYVPKVFSQVISRVGYYHRLSTLFRDTKKYPSKRTPCKKMTDIVIV